MSSGMIIGIAGLVGSITTIIAFIIEMYKIIRILEKKLSVIDETQMAILRLTIVNENIPLDERVTAGQKYVKGGGNGGVHALYEVLVEKYKEELKKDSEKEYKIDKI